MIKELKLLSNYLINYNDDNIDSFYNSLMNGCVVILGKVKEDDIDELLNISKSFKYIDIELIDKTIIAKKKELIGHKDLNNPPSPVINLNIYDGISTGTYYTLVDIPGIIYPIIYIPLNTSDDVVITFYR